MNINFVVPAFAKSRFSGGLLCVLNHAQELGRRGHRVHVIPLHPCPSPDWFAKPWLFDIRMVSPRQALTGATTALWRAARAAVGHATSGSPGRSTASEALVRHNIGTIGIGLARYGAYGLRQGASIDYLRRTMPAADITLATDAETAWPVRLSGNGCLAYFAQHYEPYFSDERLGGDASRREAEVSYRLGLHQLANSRWLQTRLETLNPDNRVRICPNAIDHTVFNGTTASRRADEPLRIISYGGRDAEWKGFRDLCQALRIVRMRRPEIVLEWSVYGSALLPSDNDVFPYTSLGFLPQAALAAAYRRHHVLLSASWYESFPLFPLEAMACGLATITTPPGTELFARHEENALLVEPRDAHSIADAVERLVDDEELRRRLSRRGQEESLKWNWTHAGDVMEAALVDVCAQVPP